MARPKKIQESLPALGRFAHRFGPKLRKQRALIGGSMLALMAEVLMRLLEPWPLSFVVDRVIAPQPDAASPLNLPALEQLDPVILVAGAAGALVIFTGLRALCRYLSAVGFALAGNRVVTEVRNELYRHLTRLSLSFHSKSKSGDLIIRVVGDVGMLREVAVTALLPMLGSLLVLSGMVAVMFWMNWQLALISMSTIPLFGLFTVHLGRKIQAVSRKQRRREGGLASTAAESIAGIKTVQALSLDDTFSEAFNAESKKSLKEGVQGKRLSARLERSVDVLTALATALVLFFGARIVMAGGLSAGELLVFLSYQRSAFRPVRNFAKHTARIARASAAGERVLEIMDLESDVTDLPDAVQAPAFQGAIRLDGVSFSYEPDHPVLRDVDLDIPAGGRVALVGPSGSGKSTIVGLALRFYDPVSGRVQIDGHDVSSYTLASLRSQISIVLEDTLLFAATLRENIAYGAAGVSEEEIEAAARLANADGFIRSLPEGYETAVGERGVTLSKGQRQRIAIARAAVRQAPIVILDEPATGLDEENEREVMAALERVSAGRTTVLVTHKLQQAMRFDQILFIEDGRIVERGTHAELLRVGGRYAAMFRAQATAPGDVPDPELARAVAG